MAQKTVVLLTCDMHDDDTPADETATFGYDGSGYEFELCEQHLEEFRETMDRLVPFARRRQSGERGRARRSSNGTSASPSTSQARSSREELGAIRDWARGNGYVVSDRGRISGEVRKAFEAAQKG